MQNLINFIENLSIDQRLYWLVPTLYGEEQVEILWHKSKQPTSFGTRKKNAGGEWVWITGEQLVEALNKDQVDLAQAEKQFGVTIMTQAVYANGIVDAAKDLFGEDAFNVCLKDAQEFFAQLLATTRTVTSHTPNENQDLDEEQISRDLKLKILRKS